MTGFCYRSKPIFRRIARKDWVLGPDPTIGIPNRLRVILEVLLIAKIPDLSFSGASWCCCSHQTNKQRILVKFSHIYRKQPSGPSGGATIKPPGAVKFGVGVEL
jgi:hypothetical protein